MQHVRGGIFALALGALGCAHAGEPSRHASEGDAHLTPLPAGEDDDGDGLSDVEERDLARRYAPIVILDRRDPYRPASIPWLIRATGGQPGKAFGIPAHARRGSSDPADWTAYVHVFPRADGGINLQYWFFYPYNDGPIFFDHDSDWEHVTVRLDAKRRPVGAYLARHEDDHPGPFWSWGRLRREGEHPVVLSARGSHATYANPGDVGWFDVAVTCDDLARCANPVWRTADGELPNIGEPMHPFVHPDVLSYAGRWGRVGSLPGRSAPFGPLRHHGTCSGGSARCSVH